ncbi:hypothetical protein [Kitasatospora mediocidica]|uniref:hypothetical protein n=1 Tax=Kitasatospora mediocidica TaxID=58352 RepID=UPI00068CE100|nr:hypothetical protein [Kitasatospora mediocidica]
MRLSFPSRTLRRPAATLGVTAAAALLAAVQLGGSPAAFAQSPNAVPNAVAHAVSGHSSPTGNRYGASPAAASSGMQYGGGPVQHSPKVYLVYWGSQWNTDTNGVKPYMTSLFNGVGTSSDTWSSSTTQYTDSSGTGPTFTGPVLAGSWNDNRAKAPTSAGQQSIASEADKAAAHFGVTGNPDAQIVVMSPHGTHPDGWPSSGFCAWHDYTGSVSYTNMPYQLDAPSGSRCPNSALGGTLDAFSIVEGHEFAESVTDPQPSSGWVDSNGEEIGDLCESNFQRVALSTGTFAMQPLWSNNDGGCVITPGGPVS